jgi:Uma2 family endonuclease
MATVAHQAETRIVIPNVPWQVFEGLAAADCAGIRFTYDKGLLEIMSPSAEHEWLHRLLGRMVESITLVLNIPIRSAGATTLKWQLKERGLEPDQSYYIAHEPQIRGKRDLDLSVDPPPDLAIEVGISSSSLDKFDIYAELNVPELWLFDGEHFRVYQLQTNGKYALQNRSAAFPFLDLKQIVRFMERCDETDETSWIRSFSDWVKEQYGHLAK